MANNTLLASDNFASGSLAAGWSASSGGVSLAAVVAGGSGFVIEVPNILTTVGQQWTGLSWPNDQVSEITIYNLAGNVDEPSIALAVRLQPAAASGYFVNFNWNGSSFTATLYREDAGSFTALTNTTGLTISAGDILSFAAVGPFLIVTQNFTQILRYADATYASGQPGLRMSASVIATDAQIASWRGYSAVQQDGIWAKQGTMSGLVPLAGDIGSGGGGIANATMLYEGNAQILSGFVFKMWFSAGAPGAESNIYYAESTDGKNWTRHSGAIIANFGSPFIFKSGSTYYLYAQPIASAGLGDFSVYTSTDGITWTSQATNILGALGGTGVWDGVTQWYFQPVAIIGGTWYALYTGGNNSTTVQLSVGVATSPDGITWTKHSGNPVLTKADGSSVVNSSAVVQVGSTYYGWFFGNQPGQGSLYPGLDPGEGVRYSTTDFLTWVGPVNSVHRSQIYEGVNFDGGQSYPNSIFTVGTQTYMYIQSAVSDIGPQAEYQLTLAIANGTIPQIVTQNEDGTQQTASDSFNRANGPLGPNWATPTGVNSLQIISGAVEATVADGSDNTALYTGVSSLDAQYSEVTISAFTGDAGINSIGPVVRGSLTADTYYGINVSSPAGTSSQCFVFANMGDSFAYLGPNIDVTIQIGDVLRLSVFTGSDGFPVISFFQNGFLILQVQDQSATPILSGYPGIVISVDSGVVGQVQGSAFSAGNVNVMPNYGGGLVSWLQPFRNFVNKK
jgi:hypothetical protein